MTDKEKAIDEFVKFTCSTETEAKSYLETAGWNTEAALAAYFDDRDDRFDPATLGTCGTSGDNTGDRDSENDSMQAEDDDFVDVETPQPFETESSPEKKSSKTDASKPYKPPTNITTLASMRNARDTEEDEDEDQLYYAGGSEHSGQQIMGNDRRADTAGEVFKHLKQMVSVGDVEVAGPSRGRKTNFSGVGYRLGQTTNDTQVVGNPGRAEREDRPELHLRLWRDGFSIGDEPLKPYTDKENREIIELILRGEVPLELVPPGTGRGKVHVRVEDMRHSTYKDPTTRGRFFTGRGHVLGNVVPTIVKNDPQPEPEQKTPEEVAPPIISPITVSDTEPTTNIAVRLPSGSRSQVRLNLNHTVEDLRTHLTAVHRELDGQAFVFMVSFPPKEVTDEKLSISDSGLVNSSLHLRIKKD